MDLLGRRPTGLWGEARWSLAVTHDVDSVRGLRCCLRIAERVEAAGFRSCFYVVGEAADREPGILRELRDRGHEIGSHDWHHDNRLCFLPSGEMEDRIRRARAGLEPYDGMGFRSPSLLRSPRLLECLGRHFGYDSSVCDTDLEYRRGCTTVFPFLLRGCLEIPATLPMDSSLTYVGYSPDRMLALWKSKCAYIRELGGLAVSVTHAEPHLAGGAKLLDTLERFLDWVGEQADCSVRLPCEIAQQSGVAGAVGT
jgi:peptidoglycan/xylan/chitin deacetylase (PgdA/CDA1 family)